MTPAPVTVTVKVGLLEAIVEGATQEEAGVPFGLTREQVRDVLAKHGYPNPGAMQRSIGTLRKLAGMPPASGGIPAPAPSRAPAPAQAPVPLPPRQLTPRPGALRVALSEISPDPDNPRGQVGDVEGLAESIEEVGLLQPLTVRPNPAGGWILVGGHRRLAAVRQLGHTHVDVVVVRLRHDQLRVAALIENLQREPLDPMSQARALNEIATEMGSEFSRAALATRLGVGKSWVSDRLDLLTLPEDTQAAVATGKISVARAARIARDTEQRRAPRGPACPSCGRLLPRKAATE